MASDIFNVAPPAWLQELARPIDTKQLGQFAGLMLAGATNAARNDTDFITGFQTAAKNLQDPNWALKEQKLKLDMLGEAAQTASQWQLLDLQTQERAAWLKDIPAIREWTGMPIDQQIQNPLTGMQSKQGNIMASQLNRAASSSAVSKSMNESKSSYDKRVSEIIKIDPEVGTGLALQGSQFPSPMNWRALEVAEQRVKIRSESRATAAEIDALARGDVPTTRIDDKGRVITTYRPKGAAGTEIVPKEAELTDGTKMVYNPKSGHFVIRDKAGKEKTMSTSQLESIADSIQDDDPENSKRIKKFLTESALKQIGGKKPVTNTGTAPAGGLSFEDFQRWKKQ